GMMCMTVADDGQGFVVESGRAVSFGLVGMRERVLMLGGRLELDSEAGEGTTLRAYIPLDPTAQERRQ
ncbi:sensory box histidine kinase, partial [Pseudomonas syringae pv. actinidiae ICMP 18804]